MEKILRLGCDHDLQAILTAVEAAPDEYLPPKVVDYAEAVCTGRVRLMGSPAAPSTRNTEKRIKMLRTLIASLPDDETEELRRELQECETSLERRTEERS